jgi:multiple sugar transport system substrate-binding protein
MSAMPKTTTSVRKLHMLVLGALLLSACGAQPAPTPLPGTPAAGTVQPAVAPTAGSISFMVFGDPAELRAYQVLVAAYEARYPGAHVELVHIPDQAEYRKRMAVDFAAGTPTDVVLINYRRYAGFAAKGLLAPLGPYLAASTVIAPEDFYPEAMDPYYFNRELMCIPQNVSSLVIYYNKNLFDQAGVPYPSDRWDWDTFLATAQALTQDTDGDGQTDQYGFGTEVSLQRVLPFIWQSRGTLVDDVARPQSLELNDPRTVKALQWFVDLQMVHHVVPNAEAEASEHSEDRFLNGRLAMFANSRRGVPTYREITGFDWDVAPLPMNRGRQSGILHVDAYCLAAAAPNKAAAWQFIEFANSPEGQTIVAQSGRTVPSLIEVANSPAFLDPAAKPAHSDIFLSTIKNLRSVPVVENWADIEGIASDELERAFYGHATVDEIIQATMRRTEEYFNITHAR